MRSCCLLPPLLMPGRRIACPSAALACSALRPRAGWLARACGRPRRSLPAGALARPVAGHIRGHVCRQRAHMGFDLEPVLRQAGALAEACERYAGEARRQAPAAEADAVAAELEQLQRSLEPPTAWRA